MALDLVTLVLLAVVTTEAQEFKCPTVRVQTLVADPEDCRRYHHCLPDGRVFSMHCPGGLVFDPRRNVCIWDSIARSCAPDHALEPIKPRQPDHSATNIQGDNLNRGRNSDQPHKTTTPLNRNPKQGHQRKPVPSRQSGDDWGHRTNLSSLPAQVTLKPRNPHSPSTTNSMKTTTTMPPKASRKVKGVMSQRTRFAGAERSAPRKEETVIRKVKTNGGRTLWPRRADQSGRRTSKIYGSRLRRHRIYKRSPEDNRIGGSIYCPSAYAYIPDPLSCFGFYQCYNWQPIKRQCPPGLHFDVKSHICNWQHHVNCLNGDRGLTFNFNRMITVYRKPPRDNTPTKTKTSSSRDDGERPLDTGNNTERPAVTVSTTLASKTSMPTTGMNSAGATNIVSTSTSTVRPSPQQLKENIVLFRYSDPLSESKPADEAAQRLVVPESSSYIKDPKSFSLETDQNKSAAKQVNSEKTAVEELSRFSNVSEKPTINRSSLSKSSDGQTANKTVTTSRPHSNRGTSDSVIERKNSHENNSDDTTVNTVTETSIEILENTSWASIQGDNSSPAPTKLSFEFQSTIDEIVPEGSTPTTVKGNEASHTNATTSSVQVDEIATTFNASSPSPFFTQQSTSEIPSAARNKTASSLTSNSTHVPIEAFKNILPAVSPIPKTITEAAAQTASSDKNQTTPLVSSMTSAPSYATGNAHTRATTMSEVPVENRPPQLLRSPGENTASQVNNTYSFSRPSPPASPPITQSTVVFHKLGVSERSDSPAGVQIEKYMNDPLHQPVTSKRVDSLAGSQDQKNAMSSDEDERGHVSNAVTNKTGSRGGKKQENERKPSSLFQTTNVGKDSVVLQSTPGMKMNRKVVPEMISSVSIPSGVTNKRLSKVQETAITDPTSPSVLLTQPEDNVPFMKMDADDQILPQRSGVAQKSPVVRDNAADSEIDYSGDAENDLDPVTVLARSTRPALEPQRNDPATAYSHFGPDPASAKKQSEWQKENLQPYFTHVPITIEDTEDRKAENVNMAEAATISTITFQNATALELINDEVVRHSQNISANRNASKMTRTVPPKVSTVLMNRDTANCTTAGCTSIQSQESAATVTPSLEQFSTETSPSSPTTAATDALPVSKSANIKPSLPEKLPLTLFMSPVIRAIQQRKDQTERKDNNGTKLQMNVDRSNPQSDSDVLGNSTSKTEMDRNHQEQRSAIIQRAQGEDMTKSSPSLFTVVSLIKTDSNSTVGNSTRFQSFSENDTVTPLSDNPVANKSNNESSHEPDSPPSKKCTVNSLASSQPVDDHAKIRVEGDLTDENQHSRDQDTANLTSVHDENSTDQPSIYESSSPTSKKNVSITSTAEVVPQSTKQTQNPTSPFSFNTTSSSSAEAIGNSPPLAPELREEKETLTAASSKEKEDQVRQKTVSTLVVSVELEDKQNLTLLDVNNTSTFSKVLNTTMESKQEITDALNPVTTTVSRMEKENPANPTILNGTTVSSTLIPGKVKSVVTVESKQMPEVAYLRQNSELIKENVTNNNAADTITYDNSENLKKSENSTISVTDNDRSNTAQQTSIIISVNTTSPSGHLSQTGNHIVANSSNEAITTAASENASSDKSGISSRTVAETGSVASENTTVTTTLMTTSTALNLELQDNEGQSPSQQLEVVNADPNSVTNAGQRDNGATTGQDSPVEAPVYRWTEQTAASKTTHSQDASLSGHTDSADKRSKESQIDTSTKPTATKGGNRNYDSKRSFVSLKDVVVWFLNHWRDYMAGTGGSHHR